MLETVRYEAEKRLLGSLALAGGLAGFAAMMTLLAPSVLGEVDVAALAEQLPPSFVEAFDLELMGSIEGFLAIELYEFLWLVGLGAYIAYSAAGTLAGDIETGRIDTLLAAPISRERLVTETYLGLLLPILLANVAVFTTVFAGTRFVGDPIAAVDLLAVHALSVPYFCCCAAFGMLASVSAPGRVVAEGVAAGGVVGAFLLQTVSEAAGLSWVGAVAPMRYYDPTAVLTASEYDLAGAGILLGAAIVLLAGSALWFREVDVS
ncbi:ABC-type transport system involved in multi-copper enzyme maturation, permease component [Halolamina pelagica]|uniref:ABC-type transport system involved in multi-copper enzyme maturation, permease component n=1 Tax=Halolamina pelagica TaxID=699431 RepID=A0A0P7HW95_9EURY|nr:ABC transporter permease subunit [Halolamina pelagica]KPN31327.1 ABC-type transport system involved in multi-copper enzyme maturation, permease component [Halolamina pelagica]